MPELPEVETIRRDLEALLPGKTIRQVEIRDPYVLTGFTPSGKPRLRVSRDDFSASVEGKRVARLGRRGKYLLIEFSDGSALIVHLRMTGQLLVGEPDGRERALFRFADGSSLRFLDRRRFGEIRYSPDWRAEKDLLALGPEPLNGRLTADFLKESFRGRKAPVHSALLNQSIVSGLGNIYVTEALFHARIAPARRAGRITLAELDLLARCIRDVLERSIATRGYSMSTYVDAMGKKGRSQLFSVCYGKEDEPCSVCRRPLRRKVLAGRGAVYCASCQK